jgi:hypothetical protein
LEFVVPNLCQRSERLRRRRIPELFPEFAAHHATRRVLLDNRIDFIIDSPNDAKP